MSRTRVVVLFGGRSVEREVSRISARTICGALDPSRYDVIPLAVTADGRFLSAGDSAKRLAGGGVPERFLAQTGARAPGEASSADQAIVPSEIAPGQADVVFPIIHGTTGEDGVLQGFLETLGLSYVGAGVAASAIGMDKAVFKALLRDAEIPSARSAVFASAPAAGARPPFDLPFFVKPANGGSSVGVVKVKRTEDWPAAVANALRYDERALAEEAIDARELECAVLGNDEPEASVVGEVVPANEFYDYEAKYLIEGSKLLIPAPVPDDVAEQIRRYAVQAFKAIGCTGMARVDFFWDGEQVLLNEINTIPGFTPISMYPKLWEASGIPYAKLIDRLIELALERHPK